MREMGGINNVVEKRAYFHVSGDLGMPRCSEIFGLTLMCHLARSICRIADVVETEYEVFLKSDPDPFDDRHPGNVKTFCKKFLLFERFSRARTEAEES